MTDIPIITIDGLGGTGKGTIAKRLAEHFGWHFLDSGALYRLLALCLTKHELSLDNTDMIVEHARALDVRFAGEVIYLEREDVTDAIRTEECGSVASTIAALPQVRDALLQRQRDFAQAPGLVADGRDMGTVVFPQAPAKIFLKASQQERAERRFKQLKHKGISVNLAHVLSQLQERDARDEQRSIAPTVPAVDAVVIDTTATAIDDVFNKVKQTVESRI